MRYYLTIIALLFAFVVRGAEPLRQSFSLNSDWQLFPSSALDSDDAEHVSLPHSFDSSSEPMTYTREFFAPREWSDRRVFLRFGGVAGSAEVVLNGRYVGEHRGNFTAFPSANADARGNSPDACAWHLYPNPQHQLD